jgi:uncharacterized membrane protein
MKPVHPLVVHFPIALLALSVTADLFAFFARIDSLRSTGWWAVVGAAIGGIVTVLAGLFDMRRADLKEDVHVRVHRHMKVGFALLASIVGLTLWRWMIYKQGLSVTAIYLDCALLTMALAAFQGWLGGELVYSDGVFVKQAVPTAGAKAAGHPQDTDGHHHH